MDITEPDAGSDMAALRTVGEQDADGNWFVTGQKIFITSGHGKYHFVIARTEEEPAIPRIRWRASRGSRIFLVPTYEDAPRRRRARTPGHARSHRGEARPPRLGHRVADASSARPRSWSGSGARASSTC